MKKEADKSYKLVSADYLYHKKIIQLIDEPVLKLKLAEMLDELQDEETFQREIAIKEITYLKKKFNI